MGANGPGTACDSYSVESTRTLTFVSQCIGETAQFELERSRKCRDRSQQAVNEAERARGLHIEASAWARSMPALSRQCGASILIGLSRWEFESARNVGGRGVFTI